VQISDAGLIHLKNLNRLECLYIRCGTNVTKRGMTDLKKALPGIEIC